MTEPADVVWETTTRDGARIELTRNELTIEMTPEGLERIDKKGRNLAEKFIDIVLPYKVEIKNIRKVKRGDKKIVLVTSLFKRCTIGIPEPGLSQLEAELNRLIK